MKTSNLIAMIVALLVSSGGFATIDVLFTKVATAPEHSSVQLPPLRS